MRGTGCKNRCCCRTASPRPSVTNCTPSVASSEQFLPSAFLKAPCCSALARGSFLAPGSDMEGQNVSPHPLLHEDTTAAIIGTFYDVYNELGVGFPEFVVRRAMAVALADAGLVVSEEVALPVWFRGRRLASFRADLVVGPGVIVEVKTRQTVDDFHLAQVLHYLKATDLEVGLLLNFGRRPEFRRVVFQNAKKPRHPENPVEAGPAHVASNPATTPPSSGSPS